MEPDVVRMYSSSPPPMDDGAEEEEDDEFGDFGGFSGVPPSASLTEFETPAPLGQSQSAAADTSPPSLINKGLSQGPFHRGSPKEDLASPDVVAHGGHGCPPGKAVGAEDWGKLPPLTQASPRLSFSEPETDCGRTAVEAQGCNGGALTNGLGPSNAQESPAQPQKTALAAVLTLNCSPSGAADDFADFSAFCDGAVGVSGPGDCSDDSAEWSPGPGEPRANGCTRPSNTAEALRNGDAGGGLEGRAAGQDTERDVGEDTERDVGEDERRDMREEEGRDEEQGMREPVLHNGSGQAGSEDSGGRELFADPGDESVSQMVGLAGAAANQSGSSVTAGRAPPPEDPEDYGDFNTAEIDASSSSPGQGGTSSPAGGVELAEQAEDREFGDAGSVSSQGFADSGQNEQGRIGVTETLGRTAEFTAEPAGEGADEEDFGDFNAPGGAQEEGSEVQFDDFPGSDSFADFSSAPIGSGPDPDTGWGAFGGEAEVQELGPKEGDSWTAFGQEQRTAPLQESEACWQDSAAFTLPPAGSPQHSRKESQSASLASRLVQLFQTSFPETPVLEAGDEILSLSVLLEPPERRREEPSEAAQGGPRDVWQQLQDVHNAFGLKHQWGGSHGNKTLLCSLGIDTRNILFTGQKKQPVIVPMYAASLGMLEPTKEPVKPISAAEKIASIAQAPPVSPEMSISPPDPAQEALPPVQFDWSSSGLTNPLDASGGSSLLNLDFFGPVEDSGSSSTTTSIPGVDPELYELTTAKLDPSSTSSRLSDAFALLMSTVEKTSTSTRKPRKEEHLSEEAVKVMEGLPDLSFMHAKVLMFPTTLTPLGLSAATPD